MARCHVIEQTTETIHLQVETSRGTVEIVADFAWFPDAKRLAFDKAHVEGAGPGALGRKGLNEVKTALAEFGGQFGAKAVIFQGGRRMSGRRAGKIPTTIVIHCP